ncbi:phage recombination protein Bet [Nesterenkonia sp. HG001]|uniref:phage recombination protein Bet n=1 Tax=Nesterenkonia sp. HG001 TaxID=2983207 RepID=UPI002AC5CD89|nr:phage recombination protein Bet [Nesterenkonia sp. HG001]MDZ5077894.1 phage recombination protein Bet [Nesterenkonia sp. HG001]
MTDASTALTITDDQSGFTPAQATALQHMGVEKATQADAQVFFHVCKRTGLDPFARQIYMIERQGKQTIQTGIDGFRLIADRTTRRTQETLGYEDTQWCGPDGKWSDVWLAPEPPAAARVVVRRGGERFPGIALFSEYAARKRNGDLTQMWRDRPAGQLAKCAEALALRRAFPQDLSGLYTSDEMQQADNRDAAPDIATTRPHGRPADEDHAATHSPKRTTSADTDDTTPANIIDSVRAGWDNPDQLEQIGKWLARNRPHDPILAEVRARFTELTTPAPTARDEAPVDAEIIPDNTTEETPDHV